MDSVVFLVDMNAFFISCETTRQPSLAGKPAAVAGNPKTRTGIILAANYEARACGVKTAMVLHEALELCPGMATVPPDHRFYEEKSDEVMELLSSYSPVLEKNSIDEAWLDMTGCEGLFGEPVEAAQRIMDDIRDRLGLMCSIGIAENKFLSKMAADMKKPLGITELWNRDLPEKLWPLPVRTMYGIGGKTAEKLYRMGIQTIGELANYDETLLTSAFGKGGRGLYRLANGIDPDPVQAHISGSVKSIGRSTTLPEDIRDIEKARVVLLRLADDIGMSTRRTGKKGRTVQITIRYDDFHTITRQATIPPTCTTKEICQAGWNLLEQNWNPDRPVRLLGISLTGFHEDCDRDQMSLFDAKETDAKSDRDERIDQAIDKIRSKHGNRIIQAGSLVRKNRESDKG